jgi:hypothetical protein
MEVEFQMSTRSLMALTAYAASITFIIVGPFDWWVNWTLAGAIWAITFPLRNARRNQDSLRNHFADFEPVEWLALALTMVGEAVLWPVSVPVGGWLLLRGIYDGNTTRA